MGRRTSLVRRPSRRSRFEGAVRALLFAAAVVSVDARDHLLARQETIAFFGDVPIGDYLFGTKWTPQFAGDQQSFGVIPLVWGTFYLTCIGLVVAVPVGVLSRRSTSPSSRRAASARSSSRCSRCSPASRRSSSATSP